jgi:hypothetical protein
MSDVSGTSDDDDKPGKQNCSTQGGLMAYRVELFLLILTVVDKVSALVDHWLS